MVEKIRMSVDLVNILNIPYTLRNIKLLWTHSAETNDAQINKSTLVETEELDSLSMDPDSRHNVSYFVYKYLYINIWINIQCNKGCSRGR